ncbi:hypothetical protein B5X24_HaOG212910 [Helicoverpa armigera]|nr:hypothetical protein B5X24_HaOG212910 [Helicoverpa armigera]
MMRFFTQMYPKILPNGSNIMMHPECLTFVRGRLVPYVTYKRNYAHKSDGDNPERGTREENTQVAMPGFVHPESMTEEGLLTQKVRQQIEEHKKKKDKPTLRNPEGRE